jgi:hypothetical protein
MYRKLSSRTRVPLVYAPESAIRSHDWRIWPIRRAVRVEEAGAQLQRVMRRSDYEVVRAVQPPPEHALDGDPDIVGGPAVTQRIDRALSLRIDPALSASEPSQPASCLRRNSSQVATKNTAVQTASVATSAPNSFNPMLVLPVGPLPNIGASTDTGERMLSQM